MNIAKGMRKMLEGGLRFDVTDKSIETAPKRFMQESGAMKKKSFSKKDNPMGNFQ